MTRPAHLEDGDPHCLYHCSRCDAHFRSEAAFMAHHRIVSGVNRLGAKTRDVYCRQKQRKGLSQIEGVCTLTKGLERHPCKIWTTHTD